MQEQTPRTPPTPPTTPTPPAPGAPVAVVGSDGVVSIAGANPADLYAALRAQRRVLLEQLERLEGQRRDLVSGLNSEERPLTGVARQGIEQRIVAVDQRIEEVGQQIAASEREIGRVAGIPGAVVETPPPRNDGPEATEAMAIIGSMLTIFVFFPLTLAYARRIWRRSAKVVSALPGEIAERFTRLEQSMESVAIEVERISEGQRFVTKILAEGRGGASALGAGAAQPVEVKAPQPEPVYRGGRA